MNSKATRVRGFILASVAASLFASADVSFAANKADATTTTDKMHCEGVNSCKGKGDCKGENGCKGKNSCKGEGFISLTQEECDAAQAALSQEN